MLLPLSLFFCEYWSQHARDKTQLDLPLSTHLPPPCFTKQTHYLVGCHYSLMSALSILQVQTNCFHTINFCCHLEPLMSSEGFLVHHFQLIFIEVHTLWMLSYIISCFTQGRVPSPQCSPLWLSLLSRWAVPNYRLAAAAANSVRLTTRPQNRRNMTRQPDKLRTGSDKRERDGRMFLVKKQGTNGG